MWLRLRNVGKKKKEKQLSFPLSWEFRMPISSSRSPDPSLFLGDLRQLINLPRSWLSHNTPMRVQALKAQLCPTLCDPIDCRLPGFSVRGISQVRLLEWIAISISRGSTRSLALQVILYHLSHQGGLSSTMLLYKHFPHVNNFTFCLWKMYISCSTVSRKTYPSSSFNVPYASHLLQEVFSDSTSRKNLYASFMLYSFQYSIC